MATLLASVTQQYILPKFVDTVLRSNVLTSRILSEGKRGQENWRGTLIQKAVKTTKNTNGTSFTGMAILPSQQVNPFQILSFSPKFYQIDVTVSMTDVLVNATDDQRVADLAVTSATSSAEDMADSIGTIFYGDGTGNGSQDFNGLSNIVDDGTIAPTYGGLSRSTYTTLQSTVTASAGTLSLQKMATLYNNISDGTTTPTMGISDKATFSYYEQLIEPKNRIYMSIPEVRAMGNKGLAGAAGFTSLDFKGFGLTPDQKAAENTSGILYFLNENFIYFTAINGPTASTPMGVAQAIQFKEADFKGNDYDMKGGVKGMGFFWTGWVKPANQLGFVGRVALGGEMWSDNPRRHGKLTGITGV